MGRKVQHAKSRPVVKIILEYMDIIKKWIKTHEKWIGCSMFSCGLSGMFVLHMAVVLAPKVAAVSKKINETALNPEAVSGGAADYSLYAVIFMTSYLFLLTAPPIISGNERRAAGAAFTGLFAGIFIESVIILCCVARGEIFPFAVIVSWGFVSYVFIFYFWVMKKVYSWLFK